jgi:hypothetical protein
MELPLPSGNTFMSDPDQTIPQQELYDVPPPTRYMHALLEGIEK